MAARGTEAKENVKSKIFEVFEGAFMASDGKTIRIPMQENGEIVEIKVTLVAAKDVEGAGGGFTAVSSLSGAKCAWDDTPTVVAEPTQEELDNVNKLAAALGF